MKRKKALKTKLALMLRGQPAEPHCQGHPHVSWAPLAPSWLSPQPKLHSPTRLLLLWNACFSEDLLPPSSGFSKNMSALRSRSWFLAPLPTNPDTHKIIPCSSSLRCGGLGEGSHYPLYHETLKSTFQTFCFMNIL